MLMSWSWLVALNVYSKRWIIKPSNNFERDWKVIEIWQILFQWIWKINVLLYLSLSTVFFLAIFRWNWTFQYSFGIVILVWYTSIHIYRYTYIYFFSIPNCNNLILLLRYLFNYWFSLHSSPSPNSIFVAWNWNRWYVCDCSMFIKCWRLWSNI